MTVALVVVNNTSGIAGKKKLVILREANAGYSRSVVFNDKDGSRRFFFSELKNANLVILVPANVQEDVFWTARVMEVSKNIFQLIMDILIPEHHISRQ